MRAYDKNTIETFSDSSVLLESLPTTFNLGTEDILHTIIQGESLLSISEKYYGTHEDWVGIYLVNGLLDPFDLTIGDKLLIPKQNG